MQERLGDFSVREKNLWFAFLLDIAVALYYWPRAIGLMRAGDEALKAGAVNLITTTVIMAIVIAGVLAALLHRQTKPEPMDERDRAIASRSAMLAGRVLSAGIVIIIGLVVVQEMKSGFAIERGLALTPLILSHMLLVALMAASMVGSLAKLVAYRLGY